MSVVREAQDFLPLSQTTYCILASLFDGAKHGYAMIKDVEQRTSGTVSKSLTWITTVVMSAAAVALVVMLLAP